MILKRLFLNKVINRKYLTNKWIRTFSHENKQQGQQQAQYDQQQEQNNEEDIKIDDKTIEDIAIDETKIKETTDEIKIDDIDGSLIDINDIQIQSQQVILDNRMFSAIQKQKINKQKKIVTKFLWKRKWREYHQKLNELQKRTRGKINNDDKQQIEQLQENITKQIEKPLQDYEKKLNLSTFFFIQHLKLFEEGKIQLQQQLDGHHDVDDIDDIDDDFNQRQLSQLLIGYNLQKIKNLYKNTNCFNKYINKQFLNDLLKEVIKNPQKNFILNIFYPQIGNINIEKYQPKINESNLFKVLSSVATEQYHEVNKLKFYWSVAQLNPLLLNQYSPLILKQLMKVKINKRQISKQLKYLNYCFLNKQVSSSIVKKIVNKAGSLEVLIDLWILTMVTISKIYDWIFKNNKNENKINLNDVFCIAMTQKNYQEFFREDLPQMLHNLPSKYIFNVFQKAIQYYKQNPKDMKSTIVSQFQQKYGLPLSGQKFTELEHLFEKDPHKINLKFLSTTKQKKMFIFEDHEFVKNVFDGQYQKVLNYCQQNFGELIDSNHEILQYSAQAKNKQYRSSKSCALYVLKKIFAQSKYYIQIQNHRLTEQKLESHKKNQYQFQLTFSGQDNSHNEYNQQSSFDGKNKFQEIQKRGLFSNSGKHHFSSNKNLQVEEKNTPTQSDTNYQQYLKIIKQIEKEEEQIKKQQVISKEQVLPKNQEQKMEKSNLFDFSWCRSVEDVQTQFKKNINKINQSNFRSVLVTYTQIPIVGRISLLLKYAFLYTLKEGSTSQIPSGLKISFHSNSGDIQKDYGEYLTCCIFQFALPDEFYNSLLKEQQLKMKRKNFKRTIAHMLLYKSSINNEIISLICDICVQQKSGFTLLEIINLINIRNVIVSYQSFLRIAHSLLQFRNMLADLMTFTKKYCEKINARLNATIFQPYISKLVKSEQYEELHSFIENFRNELKPKQYKINEKMTPEQNLEEQKIYRAKEHQRINKQIYEVVKTISNNFKRNTNIPPFVLEMYELYIKDLPRPITEDEIGTGLLVFSRQQTKYSELLHKIKQHPEYNTINVMESAMRSLILFGWSLKEISQRILKIVLLEKKYQLKMDHLKNFGLIFLSCNIPGTFRTYLEYLLKYQKTIPSEIKIVYYKILNQTNDDFLKGQINGLLDLLFNRKREKQRIQYQLIKQQQDKKAELLKQIANQKSVKQNDKKYEDYIYIANKPNPKKVKYEQKIKQSFAKDEDGNVIYQTKLTKKKLRTARVKNFSEMLMSQFMLEAQSKDDGLTFNGKQQKKLSKRALKKLEEKANKKKK